MKLVADKAGDLLLGLAARHFFAALDEDGNVVECATGVDQGQNPLFVAAQHTDAPWAPLQPATLTNGIDPSPRCYRIAACLLHLGNAWRRRDSLSEGEGARTLRL